MAIRTGGVIGLVLWAMATGLVSAAPPAPAVAPSVQPFVDRQELAGAVMLVADAKRVLAAEVVSRMSFESFLDKRLFEPLKMKDTTFWPDAKQAFRIAKSYRAGAGGRGLVETTIGQLQYPLTDRAKRFSMPAGGLFSTAGDIARYYQMLINGGELDGRRVLSASAVKEMTRRQTPANVKANYGLGLSVDADGFGHGGAYSTNTTADTRRGLIFVWLVQHAGFPGQGGKSQGAFKGAALKAFPPAAPAARKAGQ